MKTFGEALRGIIEDKGLSVRAAAMELGFRSKTALLRILSDECRIATSKNCMEAARASALLALTAEEIAALEEALEVSEIGKHTYAMNSVMRDMLLARPPERDDADIAVEGVEGAGTMREVLARCAALPHMSVTIIGRCSAGILRQLYDMAHTLPMHGIRHVLTVDERNIDDVRAFAETAFMLFSPAYTLGLVREGDFLQNGWVFRCPSIVISGDNGRGERTVVQLMRVGERRYVAYTDETGGLFRYWQRISRIFRHGVNYLKWQNTEMAHLPFPENFVQFCEHCRELEAGREIMMIRPDLPVMCIPQEILAETIAEKLGADAEAMRDTFERVKAIHAQRYQNFMARRQQTHLVVEEAAMRRFALTGRCADHVYLARAFTPGERRAILTGLLEKAMEDGPFHLWFARPGLGADGREFAVYEDYAISLVKPHTSWRLDGDHEELLLHSAFLAESMRDYMHTVVLKKEVLERGETLRILRELILICI